MSSKCVLHPDPAGSHGWRGFQVGCRSALGISPSEIQRAEAWPRAFLLVLLLALGALDLSGQAAGTQSTARIWDEEILAAIRVDRPHPPVHARNLFSLSTAMYDAWAAYDQTAAGFVYRSKHVAPDIAAARREAVSYAAYRILSERYAFSLNAAKSQQAFDARMKALGFDKDNKSTDPSTPAGVGNTVAAAVSAFFMDDGAQQARAYADLPVEQGGYKCVNNPLVTGLSGLSTKDINCWQPLAIANAIDQHGNPTGPIQTFQGPQWLVVRPFALTRTDAAKPWIDPGPQPKLNGAGDAQFREEVVEIIRRSSELTPDDGVVINISPGAFGNNTLGANDGNGHPVNPATGTPYQPNLVKRGDFSRILAEFWADGPTSETPPGHWNVIANKVGDTPGFIKRLAGRGRMLDDLEWDVKLYFVLNAALHDAACAAWSVKRYYDGGRPICFIRYMGQMGQCTQRNAQNYHAEGLPLVPGLIESVTAETTLPGQRHVGLPVGAVAVLSWAGQPKQPGLKHGGTKWILAADWMPYQRPTFVTPGFPGFVSGHSTFSRSAAEVMTAITGSPFFPGGLATHREPADTGLKFEKGPSQPVELQWGTYYDAADQAGLSRLWGGIHVSADDLIGRRLGSQCGKLAWGLAQKYFDGTIMSKRGLFGYHTNLTK